jgi:hypothetical protein
MKCITNPTEESVAALAYTLNGEDWTDLPMAKFKFNPCGKGFFSPSYNLKCKPCSTATYQDKVDSQSCIDCSNKQYANSTGSTACSDCPVNTFVPGEANKRENSTNCECLPNYYLPDTTQLEFLEAGGNITLQTKLRGFECVSCDDFNLIETAVICPGGPSQPQPQPGYWIDPFDPSIVRSCPVRRACTGTWRVCDSADKAAGCKGNFTVCRIGSAGRQCSTCVKGFYKDNANSCSQCSEDFDMLWIVLIISFVIIVALYVTIFVIYKQTIPASMWYPVTIGLSYWQTIGLLHQVEMDWPSSVQTLFKVASMANFK